MLESNCVGKCCGVFSLLGKRVCMFLEKEGFGLDQGLMSLAVRFKKLPWFLFLSCQFHLCIMPMPIITRLPTAVEATKSQQIVEIDLFLNFFSNHNFWVGFFGAFWQRREAVLLLLLQSFFCLVCCCSSSLLLKILTLGHWS